MEVTVRKGAQLNCQPTKVARPNESQETDTAIVSMAGAFLFEKYIPWRYTMKVSVQILLLPLNALMDLVKDGMIDTSFQLCLCR